jgi:uncharacterized membrane protein
MYMNIHPALVHFPIAFLSIYVILEVLPKRLQERQRWIYSTKMFLLLVGTIGAQFALMSGGSAELLRGKSMLIEKHSFFANTSFYIFLLLTIAYILETSFVMKLGTRLPAWVNSIFRIYLKIFSRPVRVILALIGFVTISITGALGGAIAYGPLNDPFTRMVYSIFFK